MTYSGFNPYNQSARDNKKGQFSKNHNTSFLKKLLVPGYNLYFSEMGLSTIARHETTEIFVYVLHYVYEICI